MDSASRVAGPLGTEGPGAVEAFLVLLVWVLFDGAATGLHLFQAARETSPGRLYLLIGALRVVEGCGLLLYWRRRGWSFDAWGLRGLRGRKGFRTGVLWSAALAFVVAVVESICRLGFGTSFLARVTSQEARGGELLALVTVGGFVAPLFEEVLFRGVLYGGFRKRAGIFLSATSVSLLFASAHFAFRRIQPVQAAGAVLFCATYELSGSLWAPLIVHMAGNLALFLAPWLLHPGP